MGMQIKPYGDVNYAVVEQEQRRLEKMDKLVKKALEKGKLRAENILDNAKALREKKRQSAAERAAATRESNRAQADAEMEEKQRRKFFRENPNATAVDWKRCWPQIREKAMLENTAAADIEAARRYAGM